MNKVFLSGNITGDPELRETPNGKKVVNFSMATNKKIKGENYVEYHNIVAWGAVAENIDKYMNKGSSITVIGELRTKTWEDQNGVKKYKTEINLQECEFGPKKKGGEEEEEQEKYKQKQDTRINPNAGEDEINIEDVPF